MLKKLLVILVVAVLVVMVAAVCFGVYRTLTPPPDLYAATGTLAKCPPRPSCVSSIENDPQHAIAPLRYNGQKEAALQRLYESLAGMPQMHRLTSEGDYLHAVFVTPTVRFHDDLELLFTAPGTIDVRSVSRFGYRDFGVNRARVEQLRAAFQERAVTVSPVARTANGLR